MAGDVRRQFQHHEQGEVDEIVGKREEGVPVCRRAACTTVRSSPYQEWDADHLPSGVAYAAEEMAAAMVAAASVWPWVDPREQRKKAHVDDE